MYSSFKLFLNDFDNILNFLFEQQKEYIFCKKGCSMCCQKGNYPFSRIEFWYITQGYINLDDNIKKIVQQNIKDLRQQRKNKKEDIIFEHKCPFLINNECCIYEYRGIICRTFGLCYYDDKNGYVRIPDCAKYGLNYSEQYNNKTKELSIKNVPYVNLRIDRVLESELAKKHGIKCEQIRPLLDWFEQQ